LHPAGKSTDDYFYIIYQHFYSSIAAYCSVFANYIIVIHSFCCLTFSSAKLGFSGSF
jgi:hypothetical protein